MLCPLASAHAHSHTHTPCIAILAGDLWSIPDDASARFARSHSSRFHRRNSCVQNDVDHFGCSGHRNELEFIYFFSLFWLISVLLKNKSNSNCKILHTLLISSSGLKIAQHRVSDRIKQFFFLMYENRGDKFNFENQNKTLAHGRTLKRFLFLAVFSFFERAMSKLNNLPTDWGANDEIIKQKILIINNLLDGVI